MLLDVVPPPENPRDEVGRVQLEGILEDVLNLLKGVILEVAIPGADENAVVRVQFKVGLHIVDNKCVVEISSEKAEILSC